MSEGVLLFSPEQVRLVQYSFGRAARNHRELAAMFYDKVFELDPELRPLFGSNLSVQGEKFMQMMALIVNHLESPEMLSTLMVALGRRHTDMGVQMVHYQTFGEALRWAVARSIGRSYTPAIDAAWRTVYDKLVYLALQT